MTKMTYTAQIEVPTRSGSWQALDTPETIQSDEDTTQDVAVMLAANQTVVDDGDEYRILVWEGAETSNDPDFVYHVEGEPKPEPMSADELAAWLGPAAEQLTPSQIEHITEADREIGQRYPGPDREDLRDAALSTVVQYLLGEITAEAASQGLGAARQAEARAFAVALQLGVELHRGDGMPKAAAARAVGVDRMSLLKALGER